MKIQVLSSGRPDARLSARPQFGSLRRTLQLALMGLTLAVPGSDSVHFNNQAKPAPKIAQGGQQNEQPVEVAPPVVQVPVVQVYVPSQDGHRRPLNISMDKLPEYYGKGIAMPYSVMADPKAQAWLAQNRPKWQTYVDTHKMDPKGNTLFDSTALVLPAGIELELLLKMAKKEKLTDAEQKKVDVFQAATAKNRQLHDMRQTLEFFDLVQGVIRRQQAWKPAPIDEKLSLHPKSWGANTHLIVCNQDVDTVPGSKGIKGLFFSELAGRLATEKDFAGALTHLMGHEGYIIVGRNDGILKKESPDGKPALYQAPYYCRGGQPVTPTREVLKAMGTPSAIVLIEGAPEQREEPPHEVQAVATALREQLGFEAVKPGQPMADKQLTVLNQPSVETVLSQLDQLKPLLKKNPKAMVAVIIGAHGNTVSQLLSPNDVPNNYKEAILKRAEEAPLTKKQRQIPGAETGVLLLRGPEKGQPSTFILETELQQWTAATEQELGFAPNVLFIISGCEGDSLRFRPAGKP